MDRTDSNGGGQLSEKTPEIECSSNQAESTLAQDSIAMNLSRVDGAIESIGWGKYQWQLALTCGFGFLVDQMLLVSIAFVTPLASMEFGPKYASLLPAAQYAGLLVGAVVLGSAADNFGRRAIWQLSIFGASIITLLAASSPNWAALNWWISFASFFAGGNLAIDLAILAESIPRTWSFMLSSLACIWGLGNTVTGLIAWPLVVEFGCEAGSTPENCSKSDNMGWRYLYLTLGVLCLIMSCIRAFVLRSKESPRWLISTGELQQAVDVLNYISAKNHSSYNAVIEDFVPSTRSRKETMTFKQNLKRFCMLFSGPKALRLMLVLSLMWTLIGIAYPLFIVFLPYYLAANGAALGETSNYITYRDFTISSVIGILGPVISMIMVSTRLRSRISIIIAAAGCVAFAGAFTTVRSQAENLAFSSLNGLWLNALYAIIYGYTPQALEVENRGLGAGLLMALGRLSSLSAPFIATFADVTSSAPIWVACGCYAVIGICAMLLPVDTTPFSRKDLRA